MIYIATLETKNFTFEGIGATKDAAVDALRAGLVKHSHEYKIGAGWFEDDEDDITCRPVEIGACYRDHQRIGDAKIWPAGER